MENSTNAKKKGKKTRKRVIWIVVILLAVAGLVWGVISAGGARGVYDQEKVKKGDVVTYYSFSGVVEAKNSESILSERAMQISDILVKEGDKVSKDDVLLKTSFGEKIKATIDGEISKLYVEKSDQIMSGMKLIDIVDYDNLQISVKVDEYDLSSMSVNKKVSVTINALDKKVSGKISSISREATNVNGVAYFTATIDLSKNDALRVGMSAEVKILNKRVNGVMTLSMNAVQFDASNQPYVLIKDAKGLPVLQNIETGMNDGNIVQIKKGVNVGQVVLIPKKTAAQTFGANGGMRAGTQSGSQSGTQTGTQSGAQSGGQN